MGRLLGRRRLVLGVLALVMVPPGAFLGYNRWTGNFGTVVPGRVYRSGQLSGPALGAVVRAYGVKTVLNLRGPNPAEGWYRDERAAATAAGATLVDVAMSSCQWMSRAQLRAVVRVLDSAERPLLIHCQLGAERTGLVAAFAELLRPGATLEDAERQFTAWHLFARVKDGRIMAEHLDQYEAWLRARGWDHSPDRFRLWVNAGFVPQTPSREQWPYDPYPLVTVTRPGGREPELEAEAGVEPAAARLARPGGAAGGVTR